MSIHNMDYKHVEDKDTVQSMELLRDSFITIEQQMIVSLKLSREASLAFTKLEEALMWGIKALAVYGCRKEKEEKK